MGKALGIDYGTKRTGIAITDAMQIIASGLTTVATHTLTDFITDIVIKENIECFVVGEPKNLDGSATDSTGHINGFVKRLQKIHPTIPVHQIDERFTSKIAKQSILASGIKKKGRQNKALVDEVSATIILQSFLDYKS
jgi:putative Holliday junction resolvase